MIYFIIIYSLCVLYTIYEFKKDYDLTIPNLFCILVIGWLLPLLLLSMPFLLAFNLITVEKTIKKKEK